MTGHLQWVRQFHRLHVEPTLGTPVGCSRSEVAALEAELGGRLPEAYREYLEWMGRDYGGIFEGSSCFIDHVFENTAGLPQLLTENSVDWQLPEKYLAWFMHQGYTAVWFEVPSSTPDPECWYFSEGTTPEPRVVGRFSEWLLEDMKGLVDVSPRISNDAPAP